ncbi:hypothetical protein PIB30_003458 [Stylosanthes scabra]|uniref:Uncharacterized protein n=1 Tax=Stylosanthes scabra TaxID=79078 RepID=A0ABU6V403_9FABA|nr:hypothetical protein [Stylosanthes scabra]
MDFENDEEAAVLTNGGGAEDAILDVRTVARNSGLGAVAKGKVVHKLPPNLPSEGGSKTRSSKHALGEYRSTPVSNVTEVDVVAKKKGEARCTLDSAVKSHAVAVVMNTENLRTSVRVLCRVCLIIAKPPPLLKAVFPWDHVRSESSLDGGGGTAEDGSDGVGCALDDACVGGVRSGGGTLWNGSIRSPNFSLNLQKQTLPRDIEVVPVFFTLDAPWRVVDTRKKVADAVGNASAIVKEIEFGANGFGLLNLVFEAQTKKENEDYLISYPLKLRMVTLLVLDQLQFVWG